MLVVGVGAVIRNAIEEGARGDDDLFFKKEGERVGGGGGGGESQGAEKLKEVEFVIKDEGKGEKEGGGDDAGEVENRFAALLDGVGEAESKRQEKKREKEMELMRQNLEDGEQESDNIFAALLDGVEKAETRRQEKKEKEKGRGGMDEMMPKPEMEIREGDVDVAMLTWIENEKKVNEQEGRELGRAKGEGERDVKRNVGGGGDERGQEQEKEGALSETARQRIALGYCDDGSLGGDYGKENPPPGLKFGAYSADYLEIAWLPS